jgi:hypothetical protein
VTEGHVDAPQLALAHVVSELEELHREEHRTMRCCIFATLGPSSPKQAEVTANLQRGRTRFSVREVGSELELRLLLDEEKSEDVVYLVPFARQLPRDVAARFARGDVYWPSAERQLSRRFGARKASPRLSTSRLARLARHEGARDYADPTLPHKSTVDLDEAWPLYLQSWLDLPRGQLTAARLFEAALKGAPHKGVSLATALGRVPDAAEEMLNVVEQSHGVAARQILAGWLTGRVNVVAAFALVGEATRHVLVDPHSSLWNSLLMVLEVSIKSIAEHPLRSVLDAAKRPGLAQALLELASLVSQVWTPFAESHPTVANELLGKAEELLSTEEARAAASESRRLPSTWTLRAQAFNDALLAHVDGPSLTTLENISTADFHLRQHDCMTRSLDALTPMIKRLASFLLLEMPALTNDPANELQVLAEFHVGHGGWADWARQELRGRDTGALQPGVAKLLAAVDDVRDRLDERFAKAYARLVAHKGGRDHLQGVERIEHALDRFALNVVGATPGLRILVLCMDGMSWANLAELWDRPNSRLASFSPLTLPAGKASDPVAPVVAIVPTITRVSRTALFLGRELTAGEGLDTSRDDERFGKHPVATALVDASAKAKGATTTTVSKPVLWLKRDLVAPAGQLNPDVKKLLADPLAPVVGVVVNAIDDQLKGSSQVRTELSVHTIPVLQALLDAAEQAGRAVLLCSDHGNISSQRFAGTPPVLMKKSQATMGGARWRVLHGDEEAGPHEVKVPAGALATADVAFVAVPYDEVTRYTPHLHAGEHGGLSLSEALAPTVLLAPGGVAGEWVDERKLFERADFGPPSWWSDLGAPRSSSTASPKPRTVIAPTHATAPAGTSLPHTSPSTAPIAAATLFPNDDVVTAVTSSEMWQAMVANRRQEEVDKVRKGLRLLLTLGGPAGRLSRDAFAKEMPLMGPRVPGFVATMAQVLNVDGEQVIGMDTRQTAVELDRALLLRLFDGAPS